MRKCPSNYLIEESDSEIKIKKENKNIKKCKSSFIINKNIENSLNFRKEEFMKEANLFLSNIQLKTKEEIIIENKNNFHNLNNDPHVKKINIPNIPNQPTKIEYHVRELMNYTKEEILKDANEYLTSLNKVTEESSQSSIKKIMNTRDKFEYFVELEESEGLKLIKMDNTKRSYYFHLEIKTNFNFVPIFIVDHQDISADASDTFFEFQIKKHKSKESSKFTDDKISYHELRRLKYYLFFKICIQLDLEVYIACCAWVYLEFLLKKGVVNKKNIELYLCTVFLLCLKFYDIDDKKYIDNFFELSYKCFIGKIKRKDILENEMKVFGNLNFSLVLNLDIIEMHMEYPKKILRSRINFNESEKDLNSVLSFK